MPRTFRMLRTLGRGSFGAVHLAEVRSEDSFVQTLAVKWLLPEWGRDPELMARLRDEGRLLALLNHEHIVRVHGLTRIEGRLAILMEPVDGVDLSGVVGPDDGRVAERTEPPVPPRAAVEVAGAVADALDAAWSTAPPGQTEPLHVVHRDIKPSNVMVTARGGIKVMDFGVAQAGFAGREARTMGQQFGTARYMAPERWLHGAAGAPSDVYALGVTLVEIASGRPFERPRLAREGFEEDLGRVLEPIASLPGLGELARRMCAYTPEERPVAADVVRTCRSIASELPGPGLRDWAEDWVPRAPREPDPGPTEGTVVAEDQSEDTWVFDAPAARPVAERPDPNRRRIVRAVAFPVFLACLAGAVVVWNWIEIRAPGADASVLPDIPAPVDTGANRRAEAGPVWRGGSPRGGGVPPSEEAPAPTPVEAAALAPASAEVPVAPQPTRASRPHPAEPAAAVAETTVLTFVPATPGTTLAIDGASAPLRRGVPVSRGLHALEVSDGTRRHTCTIVVGDAAATYQVGPSGCSVAE